jgi:hypothetical protein
VGAVHPALLHAITQAIPHNQLDRWDRTLGENKTAWPVLIPRLELFETLPLEGRIRCEIRYKGPSPTPELPGFHAQLIREWGEEATVLAEMDLVEACFKQSPLDRASPEDRARFMLRHEAVPGLSLSHQDGQKTVLNLENLSRLDWLPGTLRHIYGTADPKSIAIKEHLAAELGLHPRHLPDALPLSRFELDTHQTEGTIEVLGRAPTVVDSQRIHPWWSHVLGRSQGPVFDLLHGLTDRFVKQVVLQDPHAFREVSPGPVVFLSSHQVGLDSLLLPWICSGLLKAPVQTLLPDTRASSWLGWLQGMLQDWPAERNPELLHFAEMSSPPTLANALGAQMLRIRTNNASLLMAAECDPALVAGQPVRRLPSAVIELALTLDAPIIPIRCAHGLPQVAARDTLEFPTQLGRQSFFFGPPIDPLLLRSLSLKDRKDLILDRLNHLGPTLENELPIPGDSEFLEDVRKWSDRRASKGCPVEPEAAVLLQVLRAILSPSPGIARLLEAIENDQAPEVSEPEDLWLLDLGRRLAGWP